MRIKDAIVYKDEGDYGPVYVVRDGKMSNYQDSDLLNLEGKPRAEWFTRAQARRIAKEEGLPFEEG